VFAEVTVLTELGHWSVYKVFKLAVCTEARIVLMKDYMTTG